MDSFDSKMAHNATSWWITSLAISVVCCSILFVIFASYFFQVKEELAIAQVRSDIAESRIREMAIDLQTLNRRSAVQQVQIVPAGTAPAQPLPPGVVTPETALPTTATMPAIPQQPAVVSPAVSPPPVPTSTPAVLAPAPAPAPANH